MLILFSSIVVLYRCNAAAVGMETSQRSPQNSVISVQEFAWPNTTIPYIFHPWLALDSDVVRAINISLRLIEKNTCIRFVPHPDTVVQHYITFNIDKACRSYLGYNKAESSQVVAIPPNDTNLVRVAFQEIFRTLGRHHEHQRPDRGVYMRVMWSNIHEDYVRRYTKYVEGYVTTQGIPYDLHSVTHYSCFYGSKKNLPTMIPLVSMEIDQVGTAELPSEHDYLHINLLYCGATTLMVKGLHVSAVGTDFIDLKWDKPKVCPMSYTVKRVIRLKWNGATYGISTVTTPDGRDNNLTLRYLIPGSLCEITLWADYNPAAKSKDDGITITAGTLNAKPDAFPPGLCVMSITGTSAIVHWKLIFNNMRYANIESYSICVKNLESGMSSIEHVVNTSSTSYQLQTLIPGTKYQLRIASVNIEGTGPFSPAIEFATER